MTLIAMREWVSEWEMGQKDAVKGKYGHEWIRERSIIKKFQLLQDC